MLKLSSIKLNAECAIRGPNQTAWSLKPPRRTSRKGYCCDKTKKLSKSLNYCSNTISANMSTFAELGVSKWLCESLGSMAIHKPSDVQRSCIPAILSNKDCIGGAKTGSGKTIAFAAPMLTQWSRDPYGICGLVLTPTRELAIQIAEQFRAIGASMNARVAVIVGGADMVKQSIELQRKPHFVVATPGRLADHINSSGEDTICGLRRAKYLVLDEADRLLSASIAPDLSVCLDILPDASKRQTLLFTATITDAVRSLRDRSPDVHIHEVPESAMAIPTTLKQYYVLAPSYVKQAYLFSILDHEANQDKTAIIFVNRTQTAEHIRRTLQLLDIKSTSLHSQMPQQERLNALGKFRASVARVLVATDVASRGLDIPEVSLVINFDIPADPDDYIHRVGRTARAGRQGESISLVSERDVQRIESIEARVNCKLDEYADITDKGVVDKALKKVSVAKRQAVLEMDRDHFGERKKILQKKAKRAAKAS